MSAWHDRELWQTQILDCLAELADVEYQRRAWRGEISGEVHSLEECVEMLFGDTNLGDDLAAGGVFSTEIDAELRMLEVLLAAVNPIRSVDDVLDDDVLAAARPVAAHVRALLLNQAN